METKMSLKLLVDKSKNKVLFAESGKDLVDFLFSLLSLPMGTIVRLLTPTNSMIGCCIGNLYSSLDNLDILYMQPNLDKSLLLQPKMGSCGTKIQMLLMQSDCEEGNGKSQSTPTKPIYYGCNGNGWGGDGCFDDDTPCGYVTNVKGTSCGSCGKSMTTEMIFVEGRQGSTVGSGSGCGVGEGGGGYVKEVVTYMITDDLEVKPMSTISSISILNKYDVKDVGALEDMVVHLGRKESLDLLRASMQSKSKSVLTDVFLKKGTDKD